MTPTVRSADDGAVRILTIDNPSKRNAFSGAMAQTLLTELDRADADPSVRAVVVTGAGALLSSGHDLQEVLEHPDTAGDPVANAAFSRPAEILHPGDRGGRRTGVRRRLHPRPQLRPAGRSAGSPVLRGGCGDRPGAGRRPAQQAARSGGLPGGLPVAGRRGAVRRGRGRAPRVPHGGPRRPRLGRARGDRPRTIASVSPSVVAAVKAGLNHSLRHGSRRGPSGRTPARRASCASCRTATRVCAPSSNAVTRRYPDRPTDLNRRITEVLP